MAVKIKCGEKLILALGESNKNLQRLYFKEEANFNADFTMYTDNYSRQAIEKKVKRRPLKAALQGL